MLLMMAIVMAAGVLIYFLLSPSRKETEQLVQIAHNAADSEQQMESDRTVASEIKTSYE
ncbi:hypothetical protein KP806_25270 [Paenibacillus sp. N4]|uniref:hypothetical protein n=1 Tax=Paenibacillus vietnamensis TaxID=2590547 RepID=UPI001CD06E78|nr:hypothetical protein [Paenibacillus vietnamensis]MCA0758369.1 hypothetical protein [Paenibacillus vietnamensis]